MGTGTSGGSVVSKYKNAHLASLLWLPAGRPRVALRVQDSGMILGQNLQSFWAKKQTKKPHSGSKTKQKGLILGQ